MKTYPDFLSESSLHFPPFDLHRLLKTVFNPKQQEKLCILIDLENPSDIHDLKFLKQTGHPVQKKAYEIFYQGIQESMDLAACDLFAYKMTGGSNLELPDKVYSPDDKTLPLEDIYKSYDIILCIGSYSATAPVTAAAKKFGFRGATMHGVNEMILKTGLAIDYNQVSREAETLRQGMTRADSVAIEFIVNQKNYNLYIDLGKQEAQKSHGICREGYEIANLPAGEVYFVPLDAHGSFPIKFEKDGTLAVMQVENGRVTKVSFLEGNRKTVEECQAKFVSDPAASILGELGFGTQLLPYSGADIQDEKIFGTFHLATGRNDHLSGSVTKDKFANLKNATHDDILFSSNKTPEILIRQVSMKRNGKKEILIENGKPSAFYMNLRMGS